MQTISLNHEKVAEVGEQHNDVGGIETMLCAFTSSTRSGNGFPMHLPVYISFDYLHQGDISYISCLFFVIMFDLKTLELLPHCFPSCPCVMTRAQILFHLLQCNDWLLGAKYTPLRLECPISEGAKVHDCNHSMPTLVSGCVTFINQLWLGDFLPN